jgi:hypothetical protein
MLMRTLPSNNWMTWKESLEEQIAAGRYNPATVLSFKIPGTYGHKTVTLGKGTSDTMHVFYEGLRLYVTTSNEPLGYVGLEVFEVSKGPEPVHPEKIADEFVQDYDEHGEYILGLTPIWRAKRLANWLDL